MGISGVQSGSPSANPQHRCQCVDDIFAPIRGKMKVLKKIKKRIGLSPRSGSSGTNNLPPILFHQVHGDNIRISGNGSVARRVESFCRGIAFSSRPIKINEKIYIKFLEVSNNWSGVLRFGFTANDPSNLRYSLPKYACPDLTSKPCYWAKALAERFAERDTILYFYVTQMGDVYFGINGEEKGIFLSGVETRAPLWALFDVYGNSTGIELVDHRTPLNNLRRSAPSSNDVTPDIDSQILPSLQSLCIQNSNQRTGGGVIDNQTEPSTVSRFHQTELIPFPLHRTCGLNVRMSNDRCIATRNDAKFCLGYVFTSRPVQLGEKITVRILETEDIFSGALAFGLTSCDPALLQSVDLPEDSNSLLDRPEYWVVQKNVARTPEKGDELTFSVSPTGKVQFSKNGSPPVVFMHVDHTLKLWAFFDLYGSTQKIAVLGSVPASSRNSSSASPRFPNAESANRRLRISNFYQGEPSHGNQVVNVNGQSPAPVQIGQPIGRPPKVGFAPTTTSSTPSTTPSGEVLQFQPTMSGTVLVVNLPPAHSNFINHQQQQQQQPQRHPLPSSFSNSHHQQLTVSLGSHPGSHSNGIIEKPLVTSATPLSNFNNLYIEPVSSGSYPKVDSNVPWREGAGTTATNSECSVCYERSIDSVLYMCGHMCMCYECAVQQWKGKGGGHCPLCRAVIRDVIRTYKS